METQDGFIVGVYNYCDRWCERCALTGRCRVFADQQQFAFEAQSTADPSAAPSLRSLGALAAVLAEGVPTDLDDLELRHPPGLPWGELSLEDAGLVARTKELAWRLSDWKVPERFAEDASVRDAAEVLRHFGFYVGPKAYRALSGREACAEDGDLSDALGSAKALVLALDRMADAWLRLAERGAIALLEAEPALSALQRITTEIETRFPRARQFVRPGLDEPDAVAMLDWRERG